MQSLIFFNKEGDSLNFTWNNTLESWFGNLIFHENSDDTFKTIGLYMMEKIPSTTLFSDFKITGATISLDKFQLFNEYGINFYGASYSTQSMTGFQWPNRDPNLKSRWVYGQEFDKKFPIGTQVRFVRVGGGASSLLTSFSIGKTYNVHKVKPNAILLLGDNLNNEATWTNGTNLLESTNTAISTDMNNFRITGVNSIGVYNYKAGTPLVDNLSFWSEPQFYNKYFTERKLNIVNSSKNDGVVTVGRKSSPFGDRTYQRYILDPSVIIPDRDFVLKVTLKTDIPTIYRGLITVLKFSTTEGYFVLDTPLPSSLKPGVRFSIPSATDPRNRNFLTVATIINYTDISTKTSISTNFIVQYQGKIYRCILTHIWTATASIFPTNTTYWELSKRIPIVEEIFAEAAFTSDLQLASNVFYYPQTYTQSVEYTYGSSIAKYSGELKDLNLNYYYSNNSIYCDLLYPEDYANVEFYSGSPIPANKLTSTTIGILEQNIEILENLTTELNKDISENFRYDIVFTDIDEFGIEITINGQIYYTDVEFLYDGIEINMPWTIDQTIKNWITEWYISLANIGIIVTLEFTGKEYTSYLNTISLQTEYPNVPLIFSVRVGTTAKYHIPHTNVVINKLSSSFSINLNDIEYQVSVVSNDGVVDFDTTLTDWVETWSAKLESFDIIVSNHRSMLLFSVKEQDQRFKLSVNTGIGSIPGSPSYTIIRKMIGNTGCLLASNTVFLQRGSRVTFESNQFATGQLLNINGSTRPYNNQEYNIEFLGSQSINLSYQGPFWSTIDPFCDVAPFSTLALANGFLVNGCTPSVPKPAFAGDFIQTELSDAFQFQFGATNSFTMSYIPTKEADNFADIKYLNGPNRIFILSGTSFGYPDQGRVLIYDSKTNDFLDQVVLPEFGIPKFMRFNSYNNYLYCISASGSNPSNPLSFEKAFVVDPFNSTLNHTFTFSHVVYDGNVNESTGDVYFSSNSDRYSVWASTNFVSKSTIQFQVAGGTFKKINYNAQEKDIYMTTGSGAVLRMDSETRAISDTYIISNLQEEIYYGPWNSSIYVFGSLSGQPGIIKINGGLTSIFANLSSVPTSNKYFSYDYLLEELHLSITSAIDGGNYKVYKLDGSLESNRTFSDSGPIVYNPYDGDTYLPSQSGANRIVVIDKFTRIAKVNISLVGPPKQVIFNPDRKNIFGIVRIYSSGDRRSKYFEVDVDVSVSLVTAPKIPYGSVEEDKWGTLSDSYNPLPGITLKTREYVRRPRANFNDEPNVEYIVKWRNDDVKDIFLYDFSGDQLSSTASVPYTGPKPLPLVTLNTKENTKPDRAHLSEYQKTIFDSLTFQLDKVDSQTDSNNKPTPIEIFIGSNSKNEGVSESELEIYKREHIDFTIVSGENGNSIIQFALDPESNINRIGYISLNNIAFNNFRVDSNGTTRGLRPGQILKITVTDITNQKNKYYSNNNGIIVTILEVYGKYISVLFQDRYFTEEFTRIENYPKNGETTYLQTRFQIQDKLIGAFLVQTQTEIEDVRFKTELGNTGHLVDPSDIYIYKEYDINEQGVDWTFLNKKRKEMLMVRNDIFPYIGSYKSIINAINYFGYNDLELYEYYRNINTDDKNFQKLFKVEIPDVFDNSVKGWNEKDFLKYTLPNPKFEETNLFNLTFKITDREGTNIILYSLPEVITKLAGLKRWLQTKIIPITHKILDITGRADFVGVNTIVHKSYDAKILNVKQDYTPIDFALTEAYLSPVNSGSPVYTCRIDFYVGPVPTYSMVPDYFRFKIKTYKTYKEWNPTNIYVKDDIVSYYGKFYVNVLDSNKLKNPRKYENLASWSASNNYELGQFINYNREIYQYINPTSSVAVFGKTTIVSPTLDIIRNPATASWFYMTEWRLMDMLPVQNLSEFRLVNTFSTIHELPPVLLGQKIEPQKIADPYNFTIDTNLDPFVAIELTSDNGYGQIYTVKKYYEIRGLKDLATPFRNPDVIGPFVPIIQLTNPIN